MKIALQASESDEHIAFVRSLGLRDVVCGMPAEVDGVVPLSALEQRRDRFAANELDWGVIENLSPTLYDEIMFGAPERERQLEGVCRTIENIGKVGIPVLQYQWMLLGGLRTEYSPTGRGGPVTLASTEPSLDICQPPVSTGWAEASTATRTSPIGLCRRNRCGPTWNGS